MKIKQLVILMIKRIKNLVMIFRLQSYLTLEYNDKNNNLLSNFVKKHFINDNSLSL